MDSMKQKVVTDLLPSDSQLMILKTIVEAASRRLESADCMLILDLTLVAILPKTPNSQRQTPNI